MKKFRLIVSEPMTGQENMALDEAVFSLRNENIELPSVLRIYCWKKPCITIGYFQKHSDFSGRGVPVVRRLTGGLGVSHDTDISYSMVTAEPDWQSIYDQEKTYHLIHKGIKEGLSILGLETEFYTDEKASSDLSLCVKTFFPHDLRFHGDKVVGSSQRRRGKVLLMQGSIHLHGNYKREDVASALARGWEKALGIELDNSIPSGRELDLQGDLQNKYGSAEWNEKF